MKTSAYVVRRIGAVVLLVALSAMLVSGCQPGGQGQAQKPSPTPSPVTHPIQLTIEHLGSVPCVHYVPPRDTLFQHDILQFVSNAPETIWVTCPPGLISVAETTLVMAPHASAQFHPLVAGTYPKLTFTPTACDTTRGPGPSVVVDSGTPTGE